MEEKPANCQPCEDAAKIPIRISLGPWWKKASPTTGTDLLGRIGFYCHRQDGDIFQRPVVFVSSNRCDGVHYVHPLDYLAEHGVLAVQPRGATLFFVFGNGLFVNAVDFSSIPSDPPAVGGPGR